MKYTVTGKNGNELHTNVLLHPGEVIADELGARAMKKADFASALGIKPSHLSELLKGTRNVSALTALKIEKVFGISAEFWLRLQMNYDLQVARNTYKAAA